MENIKKSFIIGLMIAFIACSGPINVSDSGTLAEENEVATTKPAEAVEYSAPDKAPNQNRIEGFTVLEVIDFDTIKISDGNKEELISLCGVSTNVVEKDKNIALIMTNYLQFRLLNKKINIEEDSNCSTSNSIRKVYVFAEGELLNRELLSKGFGTVEIFSGQLKHGNKLEDAQMKARKNRAGVWGVNSVSTTDSSEIKMGCGTLPCPPK